MFLLMRCDMISFFIMLLLAFHTPVCVHCSAFSAFTTVVTDACGTVRDVVDVVADGGSCAKF